jgi:hypothetical protein
MKKHLYNRDKEVNHILDKVIIPIQIVIRN